ncbi:MAG: hypothetical protein J6U54_20335 [Clostridiales bacterium]|nr:hypothetical protein [Clostridiales bacterium]
MDKFEYYEPPLRYILDELRARQEDELYKGTKYILEQRYDIEVPDKDELIKCFNYDRGQYEKGFNDGLKHSYIKEVLTNEQYDRLGRILAGAYISSGDRDGNFQIYSIAHRLGIDLENFINIDDEDI